MNGFEEDMYPWDDPESDEYSEEEHDCDDHMECTRLLGVTECSICGATIDRFERPR